ncbi:uncharacterized protein [Drosophila tropicalis]|uniref:uncharacterized protein n=1 Tax=Drosophila tropicalis TaxID=46794 RepID=UPI0035ABAADA
MEGFVRAKIGGYWVYSCYLPPSYTLERFGCTIDAISVDARGRQGVIIGGDFNAWATEWGSTRPTHGAAFCSSVSAISVSRCSIPAQDSLSVEPVQDPLSTLRSPRPCHELSERLPPGKATSLESLNLYTFSRVLESLRDARLGDADTAANSFMSTLERACDESMSQRKAYRRHHKPVCWWNDSIADVRRRCFRARRMYQRARGTLAFPDLYLEYKQCCKALKKAIKDSKRECFLALCDSAEQDPWGKAYQTVVKRLHIDKTPAPKDAPDC